MEYTTKILIPPFNNCQVTMSYDPDHTWKDTKIYNDKVKDIIGDLESGYYFAKVYDIEGWSIVQYNKDDHYSWWIMGSECPIDNCDILEIGNKIELPKED